MAELSVRSQQTYEVLRFRLENGRIEEALTLGRTILADLDQAEARATTIQNAVREHIDKIDALETEIARLEQRTTVSDNENALLAQVVNLEMELEAIRTLIAAKIEWGWATRPIGETTVYEHDTEETAKYYAKKRGSYLLRRPVGPWEEVSDDR